MDLMSDGPSLDYSSSITSAGIVVDIEREGIDDVLQPLNKVGVWHALLQRVVEDVQVGGEGVLVHAIDVGHIREAEEQDRASLGRRTITISRGFNFLCSNCCQFEFFKHLCTRR